MLRKCTAQEDGPGVPSAALPYKKDDILTALQVCLNLAEVIFTVDGLLVDFEDHVAASQTYILGEGVRLHVLHDHALACRGSQAVRQVARKRPYGDAQLA